MEARPSSGALRRVRAVAVGIGFDVKRLPLAHGGHECERWPAETAGRMAWIRPASKWHLSCGGARSV